ncbi:carboxypeptidase-like regulatory domain-containing protein [Leptospira perdikensis]|uniref:Carboxypeptidase regulatory-like domain-containing protein n=1 Tax=Leptospira perdikensis TaxID=2484948 RepID=A0A4R9J9S7_9LEPT|nr:carboxypeptidase-like regulatory domain-containing protein [Leptospira perdikensis]TGL35708.1 carboxypeptidase regulatory-like domain-containing protein [Leptospira perdikensis]
MFSYLQMKKGIGLLLLSFSLFQNCYFNPIVNGILNPKVEEADTSALLGLAGGFGSQAVTVSITGQIKKLGTAFANTEVSLINPSFTSKNNANSSTTDSAGRFSLNVPTGSATLQFSDAGTPVNIQIEVSQTAAKILFIDNTNFTIQNLDVYVLGVEPPVYLELISSIPYDGLLIDDSNYSTITMGGFKFKFSEDLEYPSNQSVWLAENFITNPTIGFEFPSISKSDVTIVLSSSLSPLTPYTITLNSGIKTVAGKSIKQTTIQFLVGPLGL